MMSTLPPVTRQRAMSFEEIEEEYQERQERGTIHVDSGAEDSSSDNSDGDSDGDDSVTMPEISPRFVVERALGKGACGLVVRARDTLPPPPLQQYSVASASLSGSCGLNTDDGNGPSITSSGVSVAGGGGGGGGEGGGGGYGTVAIKRVRNVFSGGSNNARSLLNEVRLLRCLGGGGGRSLSSAEHEIGDNISDEDGDEGGITSQNKSRRHRDGSGGGGGHRHVTALYGLLRLPGESSKEVFDSVYLILEPCDSDLFKVLNSSAKLSSKQVRSLLKQVLQALAWLALHNVCHSDVKPGNLLVNRDGSLRLADFGLASVVAAAVAPPSAPPQASNSHCTAAKSTTGVEIATGVEVASAVVFDTSALIGSTSTVAPSSANLSVLESSNNSGSSSSSSNNNNNNSNNNSSTDNDAPATLALVRSASTETTAVSTAAAISTTAATFSIAASSIGIPPAPGVLFRRTSSSPTFNRLKPGFSGNSNIGNNNGNNTGRANHGLVGAGGGVGGCGCGGGGCGGGGMMRRRGSPRPLYDSADSSGGAGGGGSAGGMMRRRGSPRPLYDSADSPTPSSLRPNFGAFRDGGSWAAAAGCCGGGDCHGGTSGGGGGGFGGGSSPCPPSPLSSSASFTSVSSFSQPNPASPTNDTASAAAAAATGAKAAVGIGQCPPEQQPGPVLHECFYRAPEVLWPREADDDGDDDDDEDDDADSGEDDDGNDDGEINGNAHDNHLNGQSHVKGSDEEGGSGSSSNGDNGGSSQRQQAGLGLALDVWSAGCVFAELLMASQAASSAQEEEGGIVVGGHRPHHDDDDDSDGEEKGKKGNEKDEEDEFVPLPLDASGRVMGTHCHRPALFASSTPPAWFQDASRLAEGSVAVEGLEMTAIATAGVTLAAKSAATVGVAASSGFSCGGGSSGGQSSSIAMRVGDGGTKRKKVFDSSDLGEEQEVQEAQDDEAGDDSFGFGNSGVKCGDGGVGRDNNNNNNKNNISHRNKHHRRLYHGDQPPLPPLPPVLSADSRHALATFLHVLGPPPILPSPHPADSNVNSSGTSATSLLGSSNSSSRGSRGRVRGGYSELSSGARRFARAALPFLATEASAVASTADSSSSISPLFPRLAASAGATDARSGEGAGEGGGKSGGELGRRVGAAATPSSLDLLRWLLAFHPTKRPSAAKALKHEYFSEGCEKPRREVGMAGKEKVVDESKGAPAIRNSKATSSSNSGSHDGGGAGSSESMPTSSQLKTSGGGSSSKEPAVLLSGASSFRPRASLLPPALSSSFTPTSQPLLMAPTPTHAHGLRKELWDEIDGALDGSRSSSNSD